MSDNDDFDPITWLFSLPKRMDEFKKTPEGKEFISTLRSFSEQLPELENRLRQIQNQYRVAPKDLVNLPKSPSNEKQSD